MQTVDHLDKTGLVAKYTGHGVETSAIEEVNHVWRGEPLSELVGAPGGFDWIIASHVIEHVPDLVGFLRECERLLTADGVLSLAIPDKRYCFDHLRPHTSTGEALQAFLEGRTRHPPGLVFDYFASAVKRSGDIAWQAGSRGGLEAVHSVEQAWAQCQAASAPGADYLDLHAWRLTPASFRLIVGDLRRLGLLDLGILSEIDTVGFEFFVSMRRDGLAPPPDRVALALEIGRELAAAAR
ncbi:MAG: methyltransferase domain-containing protein [Xanthomonadales bacterium]|nr:methyltransferase domain-containing protein [Xanthomonadales bacterium]